MLQSEAWTMDIHEQREVCFNSQEFALLREAVRRVHENYDDMPSALTIDNPPGIVRDLHERVAAAASVADAEEFILRFSYRDMFHLYCVAFWAAHSHEELSFPPAISEQSLFDLSDRVADIQDEAFPETKHPKKGS